MRIGIIGAGHIGGTLARRLAKLGHQVSIANSRGPESLSGLAKEAGLNPVTADEAAHSGDVVIVTIPMKSVPDLPRNLFEGVPEDVVVVDTGNYYPQRDGRIEPIESGVAESRWVANELRRPVVKAFNNINYKYLMESGKPRDAPGRIALPAAGDDRRAKEVVMRLIDELGFDPVDAGTLDESWRQQPGTPVYGTNLDREGVQRGLKEASPARRPEFTAGAATTRRS
jgi:predicted dinucleotide-binding enzyme